MKKIDIKQLALWLTINTILLVPVSPMNTHIETDSESDGELNIDEDDEDELDEVNDELGDDSITKTLISLDDQNIILLKENGTIQLYNIPQWTYQVCEQREVTTTFKTIKRITNTLFATQGVDGHIYLWQLNENKEDCAMIKKIENAHLLDDGLFYKITTHKRATIEQIKNDGNSLPKGKLEAQNLLEYHFTALSNGHIAALSKWNTFDIFKQFNERPNQYLCDAGPIRPYTRNVLKKQNFSVYLPYENYFIIQNLTDNLIEIWEATYTSINRLLNYKHCTTIKGRSIIHLRDTIFILDTGSEIVALEIVDGTLKELKRYNDSQNNHDHSNLITIDACRFAFLCNTKLIINSYDM
jgi:hypothetical protein